MHSRGRLPVAFKFSEANQKNVTFMHIIQKAVLAQLNHDVVGALRKCKYLKTTLFAIYEIMFVWRLFIFLQRTARM